MEAKHELQRLEDENFWTNLTIDKMKFLEAVVKPVLRTVSDVDFKAMRFEKDIVEVSLAFLSDEKEKFETLKDSIIEEIGELPLSINIVAREQELIRQAQNNHFWGTITEEKFDELVQKLSHLMKFREAVIPLAPAKFNLKDIVAEKEFVEFGPQHEALSVAKHSYLSSRQLQFLDLLKNFVLEKGDVSKRNLIESPFTTLHPEGIRGIFNQKEINEILSLTEQVLAA